jgi:pimeloyl-ACP methyl ester carboxylesterase
MLRFCVALAAVMALALSIPARAEPPPVEAYGKLPVVEQISLSPSGNRFAFVAVIGEDRKLVAASSDGQAVIYAVSVGTTKVLSVEWVGEDHLLVKVSHTHHLSVEWNVGEIEFPTVLVVNLRTNSVFPVFKDSQKVAPNIVGYYGAAQVEGRLYGYFGGQTFGQSSGGTYWGNGWDLYRVDLDTSEPTLAARGNRYLTDWVVGTDGQVIARATHDQVSGDWQVLSGKFNGRLIASGNAKLSGVGIERGRTSDSILVELPKESGGALQQFSLTDDKAVQPPPITDSDGVLVDPVSRLWTGVTERGDQRSPLFFDAQAEARARGAFKAFPGLSVTLLSYTADLGRMIVKTSGGGDSGTYWLVDISTGKADPIGEAYPLVKTADVGPIEMVDWTAGDGLALHGVLNLPPGREPKNLPVIVMPHGGPEDRDYPEFWWWSQLFASRGYVVFQPNFRGSSGYGDAFRDAGFGEWGRKMQTDISDGLEALVKRGIVDPKRACIVGWSYGGYAAQAGVTLQHGLYRCSVSMAGLSDLAAFINGRRNYRITDQERYWNAFMGVDKRGKSSLAAISPAKQADQADAPILLIHGKDDSVVPIDQSLGMQRALKSAGKPVELLTLTGADHWLLHEDTRLAMAKASLDFVLKYNPPYEEPTTVAAAKP